MLKDTLNLKILKKYVLEKCTKGVLNQKSTKSVLNCWGYKKCTKSIEIFMKNVNETFEF